MADYYYRLTNGKRLKLTGDREPTLQDVVTEATGAGVTLDRAEIEKLNAGLRAKSAQPTEEEKRLNRGALGAIDNKVFAEGGPAVAALRLYDKAGRQTIDRGGERIGRGEYYGGASDIIRGAGAVTAPALLPAGLIAAPAATVAGLAAAPVVGGATGMAAEALGATPEQVELAETLGGVAGGAAAGYGTSKMTTPAARTRVADTLGKVREYTPHGVINRSAQLGLGLAERLIRPKTATTQGQVTGFDPGATRPIGVQPATGPARARTGVSAEAPPTVTAADQLNTGLPAPGGPSIPLKPSVGGVARSREPFTPDLTDAQTPPATGVAQLLEGFAPPPGGGRPIGLRPSVEPPAGARPFPAGERYTMPEDPVAVGSGVTRPNPNAVELESPGDVVARMMTERGAKPSAPPASAGRPDIEPGTVPPEPMPWAEPGRYFENIPEASPAGPTVPAIPPGGRAYMDAQFAKNNPLFQQQELTGAFSGDRSVNWARNIADRLDLEGVAPGARTPEAVAARDIPGQTPAPRIPGQGGATPPMRDFNPMGAEILARRQAADLAAAAGPEMLPPPAAEPTPPVAEPTGPVPTPDVEAPSSPALTADEVPTDLPPELQMVLRFDPTAREAWTSLQSLSKAKLNAIVKQKMPGLSDLAAYILKGRS